MRPLCTEIAFTEDDGEMKIEHLAEHVAVIPALASWVHDEWGHLLPEVTLDDRVAMFERRAAHNQIPQTLIALERDTLVGTASIVADDMSTREEFTPWLAAVYVAPEFRNRGIGSKLVRAAIQEARNLGLERLYLFTPDRMSFYARLGWRVLECTEFRGETVTIMLYELKP